MDVLCLLHRLSIGTVQIPGSVVKYFPSIIIPLPMSLLKDVYAVAGSPGVAWFLEKTPKLVIVELIASFTLIQTWLNIPTPMQRWGLVRSSPVNGRQSFPATPNYISFVHVYKPG